MTGPALMFVLADAGLTLMTSLLTGTRDTGILLNTVTIKTLALMIAMPVSFVAAPALARGFQRKSAAFVYLLAIFLAWAQLPLAITLIQSRSLSALWLYAHIHSDPYSLLLTLVPFLAAALFVWRPFRSAWREQLTPA